MKKAIQTLTALLAIVIVVQVYQFAVASMYDFDFIIYTLVLMLIDSLLVLGYIIREQNEITREIREFKEKY